MRQRSSLEADDQDTEEAPLLSSPSRDKLSSSSSSVDSAVENSPNCSDPGEVAHLV